MSEFGAMLHLLYIVPSKLSHTIDSLPSHFSDLVWSHPLPYSTLAGNDVDKAWNVQLPVFITLVMAVRRMAGVPWPGFESGGLAWFSDLTLTSVKWSEAGLMAPMGPYGIILPAAVTGLMFANLQIGFAKPGKGEYHNKCFIFSAKLKILGLIILRLGMSTRLAFVLMPWHTNVYVIIASCSA